MPVFVGHFGRNKDENDSVLLCMYIRMYIYIYTKLEIIRCDMCYTNMLHFFSGGFICPSADKIEGTVKDMCNILDLPPLVTVANEGFLGISY